MAGKKTPGGVVKPKSSKKSGTQHGPGGSGFPGVPHKKPGGGALWGPGAPKNNKKKPPKTFPDYEGEELPEVDLSAFEWMRTQLAYYGLESLAGNIEDWVRDGITDTGELELRLQQTDEWKVRFAGNEKLRAAGLPVLSVAEYLSVERSYAQVMKNYGLPSGFFDDPSDFSDFIGKSISPSELQSRVELYADVAKREDPAIVQQLQSMGMSQGDILSYFVDPDRAMPILQRKYQQTVIGAAARRNNVGITNDYLGHLADLGVSEEQAAQGFGTAAELTQGFGSLGEIYGDSYDSQTAASEVFENSATSKRKRKRLASHERAAWSGEAGTDRASFQRLTGGAY